MISPRSIGSLAGSLALILLLVLFTACPSQPGVNPDSGGDSSSSGSSSGSGPTTSGSDSGDSGFEGTSDAEVAQVTQALEDNLTQLAPHMRVNWRAPFNNSNGVKASWLTGGWVIFENGRRELWGMSGRTGPSQANKGWSFSLDPNNDRFGRRVARRPAVTSSRIHVLCTDGQLFTLDHFGNLDAQSTVAFTPSSDPTGTDDYMMIGAESDRFFYSWDVDNRRYAERRRLNEVASARPLVSKNRLFFIATDGQVSCLSVDRRDFFEAVWNKKAFGKVLAPLAVNAEASHLYAATSETGFVMCFSTLNGEILWSIGTECEIGAEDQMVVDTRYRKDRMYAITRNAANAGLWCIKTIDPAQGAQGTKLWVFPDANKILALGKDHVYVRTGTPGAYKIAVVNVDNGQKVKEIAVDRRFDQWFTNPDTPQIILGSNYRDSVGIFVSAVEPE